MHAASELEFEELRKLLGRYVRTPLGHAELEHIAPGADRESIQAALDDTAEAMEYVRGQSQTQSSSHTQPHRGPAARVRFESGADPLPAVARLRIEGATLEPAEIFERGNEKSRQDKPVAGPIPPDQGFNTSPFSTRNMHFRLKVQDEFVA